MLTPVHFNNQTPFAAGQINRVWTDRLLPHEFETVETARPELIPKRSLSLRGGSSQAPGSLGPYNVSRTHAATPPHPARFARRPLPARGERLASHAIQ
jgi:hypothetical protein